MFKRKLVKIMIAVFIIVFVFIALFAISANLVFASGGSIALANTYPGDGGTYGVIDHFLYQIAAVNSNTTVSVSIDDGPQIPMRYQGIMNEVGIGDTAARDWYTWRATIPVITTSGTHIFQFFSHYYVWQDADHFWAEFNACTTVQSFTIAGPLSTPSKSPSATTANPMNVIAALTTLPLAVLLLLASFVIKNVLVTKRLSIADIFTKK